MTYRKIAELAGVSPSTVSKALSGSQEISRETALRIQKIAEENGVVRPKYRKNRNITRIAVIVPEIVSIFYSTIVTAITEELRKSGIEPGIYISGFEPSKFRKIIDFITDEDLADGIIALSSEFTGKSVTLPMVALTSESPDLHCDTVYPDIRGGICDALEYLVYLGHRNIGFISEKFTSSKLDYFLCAAKSINLPVDESSIYISDKRFEMVGIEGAEYFIRKKKRPTAIITAYDEVALGAIHTFTENGIRIPEDISIVGINDIPVSAVAGIPLTTISTFSTEIISIAVKMLTDHINNPEKHITQHISVRCKLIHRNTVTKPKIN